MAFKMVFWGVFLFFASVIAGVAYIAHSRQSGKMRMDTVHMHSVRCDQESSR